MSSKLQQTARQALNGRDGAIVVLDPTTGAILAMYSNPTFDPNPLAVNDATTVANAYKADTTKDPVSGFAPAVSLAYQDSFQPGSTFKVVTATAAYTVRAQAGGHPHAVLRAASRPARSGGRG